MPKANQLENIWERFLKFFCQNLSHCQASLILLTQNSFRSEFRTGMQKFLNSITSEMIESRREKLKNFLQQQHNQILKRISEQSNYVLRKTRFNTELYSEATESFNIFKISCENIMNTYFPLVVDPKFLSLQSEQQLIDKVTNLKSIIERNASVLSKKLTKSKQQPQKQKKIKKSRKKGRNCKIPIESTSVMQKWLLENFKDPYPSQAKKIQMAKESKLTVSQVNNWFINARERVIKKFLRKDPKQYQKPCKDIYSDCS